MSFSPYYFSTNGGRYSPKTGGGPRQQLIHAHTFEEGQDGFNDQVEFIARFRQLFPDFCRQMLDHVVYFEQLDKYFDYEDQEVYGFLYLKSAINYVVSDNIHRREKARQTVDKWFRGHAEQVFGMAELPKARDVFDEEELQLSDETYLGEELQDVLRGLGVTTQQGTAHATATRLRGGGNSGSDSEQWVPKATESQLPSHGNFKSDPEQCVQTSIENRILRSVNVQGVRKDIHHVWVDGNPSSQLHVRRPMSSVPLSRRIPAAPSTFDDSSGRDAYTIHSDQYPSPQSHLRRSRGSVPLPRRIPVVPSTIDNPSGREAYTIHSDQYPDTGQPLQMGYMPYYGTDSRQQQPSQSKAYVGYCFTQQTWKNPQEESSRANDGQPRVLPTASYPTRSTEKRLPDQSSSIDWNDGDLEKDLWVGSLPRTVDPKILADFLRPLPRCSGSRFHTSRKSSDDGSGLSSRKGRSNDSFPGFIFLRFHSVADAEYARHLLQDMYCPFLPPNRRVHVRPRLNHTKRGLRGSSGSDEKPAEVLVSITNTGPSRMEAPVPGSGMADTATSISKEQGKGHSQPKRTTRIVPAVPKSQWLLQLSMHQEQAEQAAPETQPATPPPEKPAENAAKPILPTSNAYALLQDGLNEDQNGSKIELADITGSESSTPKFSTPPEQSWKASSKTLCPNSAQKSSSASVEPSPTLQQAEGGAERNLDSPKSAVNQLIGLSAMAISSCPTPPIREDVIHTLNGMGLSNEALMGDSSDETLKGDDEVVTKHDMKQDMEQVGEQQQPTAISLDTNAKKKATLAAKNRKKKEKKEKKEREEREAKEQRERIGSSSAVAGPSSTAYSKSGSSIEAEKPFTVPAPSVSQITNTLGGGDGTNEGVADEQPAAERPVAGQVHDSPAETISQAAHKYYDDFGEFSRQVCLALDPPDPDAVNKIFNEAAKRRYSLHQDELPGTDGTQDRPDQESPHTKSQNLEVLMIEIREIARGWGMDITQFAVKMWADTHAEVMRKLEEQEGDWEEVQEQVQEIGRMPASIEAFVAEPVGFKQDFDHLELARQFTTYIKLEVQRRGGEMRKRKNLRRQFQPIREPTPDLPSPSGKLFLDLSPSAPKPTNNPSGPSNKIIDNTLWIKDPNNPTAYIQQIFNVQSSKPRGQVLQKPFTVQGNDEIQFSPDDGSVLSIRRPNQHSKIVYCDSIAMEHANNLHRDMNSMMGALAGSRFWDSLLLYMRRSWPRKGEAKIDMEELMRGVVDRTQNMLRQKGVDVNAVLRERIKKNEERLKELEGL